MSRDLYWIWLSLRMGPGREGVVSLLEHFGSPQGVYEADARELSDYFGSSKRRLCDALQNKNLDEAYSIDQYCSKNRITILRCGEKGYPKLLTNLKNPPIILYARGRIADLDSRVSISVVGTRSLSEYGRQTAYKIGYELGVAGAVVVSGLALGIDSVAACGALDARGRTVAVLGSGLDRIYPAAHKKLASEVVKKGLLLSEYPPLTPPTRGSFPQRNRIISGLSQGTLVVEAGEKSGALITANLAVVQGRDLYALPGNVDSKNALGTNALIKEGATAITCAADILENYKYLYGNTLELSALERLKGRSELKQGALLAHGVAEGEPPKKEKKTNEAEQKKNKLAELLHLTGRIDGETVKAVSGQSDYPVYDDDKRASEDASDSYGKPGDVDVSGVIPEDLGDDMIALLRAMPVGEVVGLDYVCELGYDPTAAMSALTVLEMRGLVSILPGNTYIRR